MSGPFGTIRSEVRRESQAIVDVINTQLKDLFGVDIVTGLPIWRVSWSEDQFEHRYGVYTDYVPGTNIFLRNVAETRYVPKYRQYCHHKHILERLVIVPEVNAKELPDTKISYEPLWVFQTRDEKYLPPTLQVCKFIIDTVLDAQAVAKAMITGDEKVERRLVRYADPDNSQEAAIANQKARIDGLVEELWGDESSLGTETFTEAGSTIIVPHKQFGDN